jgi:transcription antitermination factor NusG
MDSVTVAGDGEHFGPCEDYLFPEDLFEASSEIETTLWKCVRSRPRWEKKLARFLRSRNIAHYLPVVPRTTCSGRKVRTTMHPLFPGFIFVKGDHNKRSLMESGCVVHVLKPNNSIELKTLDRQIRAIQQLLLKRPFVELCTEYRVGESVTILSGPMTGITGDVVHLQNSKRLVLWVNMLGVGVSVVLSPETFLSRTDVARIQNCRNSPFTQVYRTKSATPVGSMVVPKDEYP